MFNPNRSVIDAFLAHVMDTFTGQFPEVEPGARRALETATVTALETLLNCDCSYHDLSHTVNVTEVGQTILAGRQLARGDLSANAWLQGVVAMLFHDIGYLRQLLSADDGESAVIDDDGNRIKPPRGATDAFMTPYHVNRGAIYITERFANEPHIDTDAVGRCIEMTRFPVPSGEYYAPTDTLPSLVRAADLIGQMADPQYLQKLARLFAEFVETGEAARNDFSSVADLRRSFPEFFYTQVHPYIGDGIAYLKRSQEGQQWIANLYHNLHVDEADQNSDPRLRAPELIISND